MGTTYIQWVHPLKAAAVTALTRASPGTIVIPAGHSGRLKRILAAVWPTVETVVNAGGLVEIENDAIKATQISFTLGGHTAVTEGGSCDIDLYQIDCDYPLVGPSTYTAWYTPYDDQSQTLSVGLEWEVGAKKDTRRPNYIKSACRLKANGVAAITKSVAHNTIAIPSGKGGRLLRVEFTPFGTLETVVNSGGLSELISSVDDWKPNEYVVPGQTSVGASGGGNIKNKAFDVNKPISGNASVTHDLTPYDDQNQTMAVTLMWRGPDPQ